MRLNVPSLSKPMGNMGTIHWGLDLQGVKVGDASVPVNCSLKSRKPGMITACGAIPDSGTTLLLAPSEHVQQIYTSICNGWERCIEYVHDHNGTTPAKAFVDLLGDCDSWTNSSTQLDQELPPLTFQVAGSEGVVQPAELKPSNYIGITHQEVSEIIVAKIFGVTVKAIATKQLKKMVCTPMFGANVYNTAKHGPVWILGTPLFYALTVGFDITGKGSISLENKACTKCGSPPALLASGMDSIGHAEQPALRRFDYVRETPYDVNLPL